MFAWTDAWHRGGHEILDWDFGLTTRTRAPKPALAAIGRVYASRSRASGAHTPRVSVVVCSYNGAATLGECLEGIAALRYPDYEVIVISDGSTDETAQIAAGFAGVRVVVTEQLGLSAARNAGFEAARGEIVAYIDDDAIPDPDWLTYLAKSFASGEHAAVGGPNVPPAGSGSVAQCVANAPGGPTHVLLSDREAEHIPGCNMAIRKAELEQIGGFDPRFRAAGDDVDICWRLLDSGRRIAFAPGAVVCHHRRGTVSGYLRQQRAYGAAEALLEQKHPEKYTASGHVAWGGRMYGNGAAQHRGGWRWRVYYGGWGTAFYQSLYGPRNGLIQSLPLMPEWYLAISALSLLSIGGALWRPLLLALPLLALAVGALIVDAGLGAARARFMAQRNTLRLRALTGCLYLLQPLARLSGRLGHGLSPWRRRGPGGLGAPLPRSYAFWSERWSESEQRVRALRCALQARGSAVDSGGGWDRWDLQVRGGLLGVARLRLAIEEHGAGRQLVRVRSWPHAGRGAIALVLGVALLVALARLGGGNAATLVFAGVALALVLRVLYECGVASAVLRLRLSEVFAAEQADGEHAAMTGAGASPVSAQPLDLHQLSEHPH